MVNVKCSAFVIAKFEFDATVEVGSKVDPGPGNVARKRFRTGHGCQHRR